MRERKWGGEESYENRNGRKRESVNEGRREKFREKSD